MSEGEEGTQSATKRRTRDGGKGGASGRRSAPAGTIAPTLDEETAAALTLYNTYLVADREQQAHERALKKAEKAKDEAAAAVRKLNSRKASAAETAEAETKYRESVEALRRLQDGDTPTRQAADEKAEEAEEADDTDADAEEADEGDVAVGEKVDDDGSVGVEAPVGDDDLAGDEPTGVAG